jgi:hypothetical protein
MKDEDDIVTLLDVGIDKMLWAAAARQRVLPSERLKKDAPRPGFPL